ncbi:hypothetical protein MGG_15883 [Pyricularia oryzae 70-15]|uniref:Secreted protein n=5 Tax=Pyricularia TaxID=48558 RepID=A0ABQ8NIN3_PYRGI|nr:uncharacterized protein MGG_15883 [Pyricularia oryzae 70-15]ELQ39540.1 hypothetical protein OOU_Y34scaffold00493g5 [Pyricularia oryzae Y34]KAI6253066.1 hypothetical protein MCOR19_010364 [Pyricularia oryzae]KAI6296360.1 hypothetical protein MCOR33_007029 [Pyricularia grisea]EHA55630.1 hypothetical protein MGG_15883 [Pyricularia oryzae 70-15]KAI6318135.1 hypothetical protein MCOR29_006045 [Pyricularia oryzae]
MFPPCTSSSTFLGLTAFSMASISPNTEMREPQKIGMHNSKTNMIVLIAKGGPRAAFSRGHPPRTNP